MMSEGNILVFGGAENDAHGIILVVGREPNNSLHKSNKLGGYGADWLHDGRGSSCQFWDMAYSLAGRITGHSRKALKGRCAELKSSPIAFADLSPKSLDGSYSTSKKVRIRRSISSGEYSAHMDSVFSHQRFMERVSLVVCAGHRRAGLTNGYPILERMCLEREIDYCHITSLNSTRHTLDYRLGELGNKQVEIRKTFDLFFKVSHVSKLEKVA